MCCGNQYSEEELASRLKSAAIDRQIDEDYKKSRRECKILLLGSGESGKSTIVKQMKIIHQNGYTPEELSLYKTVVYKNVLECTLSLIHGAELLDIKATDPEACSLVANYPFPNDDPNATIMQDVFAAIDRVWTMDIVPQLLERRSEFYLMDSAEYFYENLQRISAIDYLPTETDVLRARTKTTGVYETRFCIGNLSVHMFDVGGQRSERKKWIHCFEAVTSIIFCVAINEYDQVLLEDSKQNRMFESLQLFDSIVNSRWFMRTSIILFLNKIDIFIKKIAKVPMDKFFEDYQGGPDVNKAAKYILWRFSLCNRSQLRIYPHLTQATDTSNIRLVFAAVKETVLQNALHESGII